MMIQSARPLSSRRWSHSLAAACILTLFTAAAPLLPTLAAAPADAAPATAALDATDAGALRPHLNEQVTVQGTPTATGVSKTGTVAYLNFARAHQGVALVFFLKKGATGKASTEDDLKPFVGKPITVTGKLTEYKGDLQINVELLDDIKVNP